MTRGGGRGMKILRGASKIFRHPKGGSEKNRGGGGSENVYTLNPKEGGAPEKWNH